MLLNNLVEAGIVQLDELGEIVNISNNIAQVLLEKHELFLARSILADATLFEAIDNLLDLALTNGNAAGNLHSLHLLLCVDLFEFALKLADESRLVIFDPFEIAPIAGLGSTGGLLEFVFQGIVVDIVPLVLVDNAGTELLAELHDDDAWRNRGSGGARTGAGPTLATGLKVLDNQHERIGRGWSKHPDSQSM